MVGVVLYTGRWRADNMRQFVTNHKIHLIRPYELDVVVIGYAINLCNIKDNDFERIVRPVWNMHSDRLKVKMISTETHVVPHKYTRALSAWKKEQYSIYFHQFIHLQKAIQVAHQWKQHSFYVRARIDVLFSSVPVFAMQDLDKKVVYATRKDSGWRQNRSIAIWQDWLYVSNREGMACVANVSTEPIFSNQVRGFGTCPEEQVYLQLKRCGYVVKTFEAPLVLTKYPRKKWCSTSTLASETYPSVVN